MTTITFESVHKAFNYYHEGPPASYSPILTIEEDPEYGKTVVQFFIERTITHGDFGRIYHWVVQARQIYVEAGTDYTISQWYVCPSEFVCYDDAVAFADYALARAKVRGSLGASGMQWDDSVDDKGNPL